MFPVFVLFFVFSSQVELSPILSGKGQRLRSVKRFHIIIDSDHYSSFNVIVDLYHIVVNTFI